MAGHLLATVPDRCRAGCPGSSPMCVVGASRTSGAARLSRGPTSLSSGCKGYPKNIVVGGQLRVAERVRGTRYAACYQPWVWIARERRGTWAHLPSWKYEACLPGARRRSPFPSRRDRG